MWAKAKFHLARLWSFLKELGLAGWAGGSIVTFILACLNWLHDRLPWSICTLIVLTGFALFALGYRQFVLAHRISRFDPKKFKELGHRLVIFSRDALVTMNDWDRVHPLVASTINTDNPRDQWEAERKREADRASAFVERHMSQAVAFVATLRGLAIYPPFHVATGAMSRPHGFIVYLGAVGSLLEQGLIEEAREMSDLPPDGRIPPMAFHLLG